MTHGKLEPALTTSNKRLITNDWANAFPDFHIYKPMWLVRRSGPLVSGVCLDRTSGNDEYRPTFHVHCLARLSETISLTLFQRLRSQRSGTEVSIKVRFHYDHVKDAIDRLKGQVQFPLTGPIHLSDVVNAYYTFMQSPYGKSQINLYEDLLAYYCWCGNNDLANKLLIELKETAPLWDAAYTCRDGGVESWIRKCESIIKDPAGVRRTVDEQVTKLKLSKVSDIGLICDA